MKKTILFSALSVLMLSVLNSCNSEHIIEDVENATNHNSPQTCKLILDVSKSTYSDEGNTRATNSWVEGDKIYLTFTTSNGLSYGDAIYENNSWTVSYYGSLTEGSASKCVAVYFDNPESESSSVVQLTEYTGIYEDQEGIYTFNDGVLAVTANLSPKIGRIKFAGNNEDTITVYGISHYTTYDASLGKYTTSDFAIKTSVTSEYTPYIYGTFTDTIQPRLNLITTTSGYTKFPSTQIFKKAESGYMNIPTQSSHIGWQNSVIFKVKGVEFTMIPVDYSEGFFLLAETELTQELYYAIMNKGETSSQKPYVDPNITTFLSNINTITNLNFYTPSVKEWQFAFKGGNKSKGYTYSGSNIIDDVAWYSDNSNGTVHEVKQLQPNELGFYDMSGNLAEYVISSNNVYVYGGDYYSSASSCTAKNTGGYQTIRMALKP